MLVNFYRKGKDSAGVSAKGYSRRKLDECEGELHSIGPTIGGILGLSDL